MEWVHHQLLTFASIKIMHSALRSLLKKNSKNLISSKNSTSPLQCAKLHQFKRTSPAACSLHSFCLSYGNEHSTASLHSPSRYSFPLWCCPTHHLRTIERRNSNNFVHIANKWWSTSYCLFVVVCRSIWPKIIILHMRLWDQPMNLKICATCTLDKNKPIFHGSPKVQLETFC